jgi:hypothetical protein
LEINNIPRRDFYLTKKGKIKRLRPRNVKIDEDVIVEAYASGLTGKDINRTWGATRADIYRILKRKGISADRIKNTKKKREAIYETLLKKQKNKCAICGTEETRQRSGKNISFSLDHDHRSGIIRGVLCGNCNTALGLFGDNLKSLNHAILYLRKYMKKNKKGGILWSAK